jgi:(1->4)-alpha-D-glucan 1-alpha-D-glucosylmutase
MWPLGEVDARLRAELRERVTEYMLKATREAKVRTSWTDPDTHYERALTGYIGALFAGHAGTIGDVERFARRIALPGIWNALARALVHCTAPGTPDIYQGDELWNFSLVDPDNRRPVDFSTRDELLTSLERDAPPLGELLANPADGRLKLHTIHRALCCRRAHASLFATGSYHPLVAAASAEPSDHHPQHEWGHTPSAAPSTDLSRHIFAFARHSSNSTAIIVVPRLTASFADRPPIGSTTWHDTLLPIPPALRRPRWRRSIARGSLDLHRGALLLSEILAESPVEVVVGE